MKIYAFIHTDNVNESAYGVQSLHRTKEGAQEALDAHKALAKKQYDEDEKLAPSIGKPIPFGTMEDWDTSEYELLD